MSGANASSGALLWAAGIGGVLVLAGSVAAGALLAAAERRREARLARRRARATNYGFDVSTAERPAQPATVTSQAVPPATLEAPVETEAVASAEAPEPSEISEPVTPADDAQSVEPAVEEPVAPLPLIVPSSAPARAVVAGPDAGSEPTALSEALAGTAGASPGATAAPNHAPEPPARGGTLRGILRWLASETEADAAALLEMRTGGKERLVIEPAGLPDPMIAELAAKVRDAMLTAPSGETALPEGAAARWLGSGGVKSLLLAGVSPVAAADPLRFARSVIEWLAASHASAGFGPAEERALAVPGVVWAEQRASGALRLLAAEDADGAVAIAVERALPGVALEWVGARDAGDVAGPASPAPAGAPELRARLVDVAVLEDDEPNAAEVRLLWEGSELRGLGRADAPVAGEHLAAARAAVDALKPLLHGDIVLEHLHVMTFPPDLEVVVVTVAIGGERLVGAALIDSVARERSAAKAILHAVNRRLVMLAGRGGRL